jgi:hypothetical protein
MHVCVCECVYTCNNYIEQIHVFVFFDVLIYEYSITISNINSLALGLEWAPALFKQHIHIYVCSHIKHASV